MIKRKFCICVIVSFCIAVYVCANAPASVCGPDTCAGPEKQIAPTLEMLRGLNYSNPQVPILAQTPDQALQRIAALRAREAMDVETLTGLTNVYKSLGAIPSGFDLKSTFGNVNKSLSRSLYAPEDGTVYITEPGETPGWTRPLIKKTMKTLQISEAQFLLTRELGFALLDQNFSLAPLLTAAPGESDRALAVRSLASGDAVMMQTDFLLRNTGANSLALQDPTGVIAHFAGLVSQVDRKQLDALPAAVAERITFPFVKGYQFVLGLRASGGWPLVNAAYKSPPLSTEQVLHPEKYFAKRDIPIQISLPLVDDMLGAEYVPVFNDVMGEFGILTLLESIPAAAESAETAAEGWGGDRTLAWQTKDGKRMVIAMYTTWDTPQDALEFESALKEIYPDATATGPITVSLIGRDVLLLTGAPDGVREKIIDTLWQASKNPVLTAPPQPAAVNPQSPFFDQQLMFSMLSENPSVAPPSADFMSIDGNTYTSKRFGYRLKAPNDNWRFQRFTLGRQIITEFTAFHKAYVGSEITLETYDDKITPGEDDPVDDMAQFLSRQMGHFKMVSERRLAINGLPARETEYEGVYLVPIIFRYTEIFAPEKTYVFTCAAAPPYFKKLQPEFDGFINSFELLK